jgi:predicted nucleic acid-binding protein
MADPPKAPRAMTDANVLLAGNAFPRWPYEVLQHAIDGDFKLVFCPLIVKQAREHLEERFPAHLPRFERFLREVEYDLVPDPTQEEIDANKNLVRDLSDVVIALAAIAAGVDYLISEDKDFTVRDETTAELRRHVNVLLSGTFLREVMGWTSEELEAIRRRTWGDMQEEEKETSKE